MTEGDSPPPLKDFDARLRALRKKSDERTGAGQRSDIPRSAMGYAFRIGVELVAGLVVGAGIGWLLDKALGTSPFLLILFFFLGSAAGILNVFRAARQMERTAAEDETKD
jgi:ATP synthase protein I